MDIESKEVGTFTPFSLGQQYIPEQEEVKEEIIINETPPEEPQPKEEVVEQPEVPEQLDDSNFSASALILKAYADDGLPIDVNEIDPNLSGRGLLDTLRAKLSEDVRSELEQEYQKMGYNDEFKRTIEFLKNGGSIEDLQQSFANQSYAQLDIEDDDDITNREILMKAYYKEKGFSDDKINKLINLSKSSDDTYNEALEAQSYFANKDQQMIESQKQKAQDEYEASVKLYEENQKTVDTILKAKVLGGIEITDKEAKDIKKAMYDQTETYKYVDENGKERLGKMTKYEALLAEYNNNAEWQLTFVKLLLDGFKFSKIANKVVKNRDSQINDVLGARLTNATSREKAIRTNHNNNQFGTNPETKLVGEFNIK